MDNIFKLAVILSAVDHLSGPLRDTARQLQAMDKVAEQARGMREFGERITLAGAAAAFGASEINERLKAMIEPAMRVEDATAFLGTVLEPQSGTVAEAMERMQKAAISWSREHTDSADAFIKTTYRMISAGLNERAALEATRTAMTAARATTLGLTDAQANAGETANLLATIYNNMGNKRLPVAEEMARLGDIITGVQQKFQFASLAPLTEGMKAAARTAVLYRVDVAQAATVIGQLNNAGVQGASAGYAFNEALFHMEKAAHKLHFAIARTKNGNLDLIGTIANMEKRFGSLEKLSPRMQQKLEEAFGMRGIAIAQVLGKSKEMADMMNLITSRTGAAATAQRAMEGTTSGQWQIMKNNLEVIEESLGDFLLPFIKELTPYVKTFVDTMTRIIQAQPAIVRIAVGFFAILGYLLAIAAPLLTTIGGLAILGGYGAGALAKLATGFIWVWGNVLELGKSIWVIASSRLPLLMQWFANGGPAIFLARIRLIGSLLATQLVNGLRLVAVATWEWTAALLANPVVLAIAAIVALIGWVYLIYKYWSPLADFYESVWAKVKAAFQSFDAWLSGWPGKIMGLVLKLLTPKGWYEIGAMLIDGLVRGIKSGLSAALTAVGNIAHGITDRIKKLLGISSPSKIFFGVGGNIVAGLAEGITNMQGLAVDRMAELSRLMMGPALGPMIPSAAGAAPARAGHRFEIHMNPVFNVTGGSLTPQTRAEILEYLRGMKREIAQFVDDVKERDPRMEY
jgi:TP901 family phage tail tape measure protein